MTTTDHANYPLLTKPELSTIRRRLRRRRRDNSTAAAAAAAGGSSASSSATANLLQNVSIELDEQSAIDLSRDIRRASSHHLQNLDLYCKFVFTRVPRGMQPPRQFALSNTVKCIDLSHTKVGNAGAELLASLMPKLHSIEEVNLRNCAIKNDGMRILAESLPFSLEHLDLSWNGIGESACAILCQYLSRASELWSISLEGMFVPGNIAVNILRALSLNGELGVVEISKLYAYWNLCPSIRKEAGLLLAQIISNNRWLSYLGVGSILDLDIFGLLVDELCKEQTLLTSTLNNAVENKSKLGFLDATGIVARRSSSSSSSSSDTKADGLPILSKLLSRLVRENTILDGISLRNCKLQRDPPYIEGTENMDSSNGVHPVVILADALRHNRNLDLLDLRDNELGATGVNALTDMLSSNAQIAKILIGSTDGSWRCYEYYDFAANTFYRKPYGVGVAPAGAIQKMKQALEWNRQAKVLRKAYKLQGDDRPNFLNSSFPDEMLPGELAKITTTDDCDDKDDKDVMSAIYSFVRCKHPALMASLGRMDDDGDANSRKGTGKRKIRVDSDPPTRRSKRLRSANK